MIWPHNGDRLELVEKGHAYWQKPLYMEMVVVASWSIWKERNNKLFNGIDLDIEFWSRRFKQDFTLLVHRTKKDLHHYINNMVSTL
jgi:hypothetical protein